MFTLEMRDATITETGFASYRNGSALPIGSGSGDGNFDNGDWSSLIGIVTAIIGNILISFALNTQRYAHIRINREFEEKERERRRICKRRIGSDGSAKYGTAQESIAEERAKLNLQFGALDSHRRIQKGKLDVDGAPPGLDREEGEAGEADPLIPQVGARRSIDADSQSTAAPTVSEFKQKSYLRSPYWWIGIILMTTGEAGNFLAYGFAPASIVSPLGVVALIFNCIIAPFMLKEPFRKRDALGVTTAVAGAVTVVLSASDHNPKLGPDEIWELIDTWEFKTYLGITIFLMFILMAVSKKHGEKSVLIDLGLVALFGAYTALSTKGVASMLSFTLWHALTFPVTYMLGAILVFTAVMQIKYINRALQRFDATEVIPTQFVLFTLSVILGSAVLYRDFEKTPGGDAGKFVGGCVMTFLGVYLITSARVRISDEELAEPGIDESITLIGGPQDRVDIGADHSHPAGNFQVPSTAPMTPGTPSSHNLTDVHPFPQTPDQRSSIPQPPETPTITLTSHSPSSASTISSLAADSPLTRNPWLNDDIPTFRPPPQPQLPVLEPLPRSKTTPPPLQTTTSAPILPSEVTVLTPRRPITPRNASDDPPLPHSTPTASTPSVRHVDIEPGRASALARNSMAGILPGPLTSPLSASLSAVIADSLRRGVTVDGRRRSSRRPRIPSMAPRRRLQSEEDEQQDPHDGSGEGEESVSPPHACGSGVVVGNKSSPKSRGRSWSASLQDLLRGKRLRTDHGGSSGGNVDWGFGGDDGDGD